MAAGFFFAKAHLQKGHSQQPLDLTSYEQVLDTIGNGDRPCLPSPVAASRWP
jgi:hypothetical protein